MQMHQKHLLMESVELEEVIAYALEVEADKQASRILQICKTEKLLELVEEFKI